MFRFDKLPWRRGAGELRKSPFTGFLVILLLSIAAASAQPRLAIIPEDSPVASIADVLTVQFTKKNQVTLLERDQIEKIYHEQELSAGNADYLKLGHILGADGLLLLRTATEGTNEFLTSRLVAVKPGVMLTTEKFLWPITKLDDWSAAFAPHLNRFLPKLTVLEKDAVPISVINLRSAVSSPAGLEAERQLKLLTLDRLGREKQLFVLERQRMELLNDENQLKGLDDSTFWSGSYLLDGVIDRDGYSEDRMTVSARLTPPRGGTAIEIEVAGKRGDLAGLTDELVKKVVATLNIKSTLPAWNAADEAEEFFAEAKWASRWGLYIEAQAASESAWALGKRSRDLTILRVWSYADDVSVIGDGSGIELPCYPNPEKLRSAIRAADLFSQEAAFGLTNSTAIDDEMFSQGIHVFKVAASLLDGFYLAAELRSGHEDELAELRRLARRVQQILDSKIELVRADKSWSNKVKLDMYDWAKWEEGCVLFEKPEDSLPMFQRMLETGYSPTELPRITGWSWTDRKRVPKVTSQFIAEISASTNASLCVRGHCLSMIKTEYYPEATFHVQEQALLDTIWNHRDWIFSSAGHASALGEVEAVLREKYGEPYENVPFREEPFVSWKQNLRKTYLTTQTNFDPEVVRLLCDSPTSPEQARELAPLMESLPRTNWQVAGAYNRIRQTAGLPPTDSKPTAPKAVMPAQEPIAARFISWNGIASAAPPYARSEIEHMIVRDGRLWAELAFLQQNDFLPFATPPVAFAGIDLKSGKCETIPAREKLGVLNSDFEVTSDSLYVGIRDHIERYRRREKTWEPLGVPITGARQILEFRGKLYVSTSDSLLEVAPDSGAVRILASGRRTPPANEMDPLLAENGGKIVKTENQLFLSCGKQAFVFMPTNQIWRPLPTSSISQPGWQTKQYFSDAGELFFSPGMGMIIPKRYTAMWLDAASLQLLLKQDVEKEAPNTEVDRLLGQPCWDWPNPFCLDYPCVIPEGKSFWMLHPRKPEFFFRQQEPVLFKDDRDATLLHFEPGRRKAMGVPIRFEKDSRPINPFDRKQLVFAPGPNAPTPLCFLSPDGLIISCHELMGHWLIPRSEIEKRLVPLKFESPETGGPQP